MTATPPVPSGRRVLSHQFGAIVMRPLPSDRVSFRNWTRPGRRVVLPTVVQCPHCSAENPASGSTCSDCGMALAIYIGAPKRAGSYSLGSVMLIVAATSVGLALTRAEPPLGVLFLAMIVPALCRTLLARHRERAWGTPLSAGALFHLFFTSMLLFLVLEFLVGLIWWCAVIVCQSLLRESSPSWKSVLMAAAPAGAFAWWLGRALLASKRG